MSDKLIERADSLMHRRSFVAGANEPVEPVTTSSADEPSQSEEVPVLTDVVDAAMPTGNPSAAPLAQTVLSRQIDAAVRDRLAQLLTARQAELTREIETWLDEQMPQLVIRAMDGITDHLVALLTNRARDELLPRLESALRLADEDNPDTDSTE